MNKGWFTVPGIRNGDRTLKEQMMGLQPALEEAKGKTVLDLGCAEGMISREFALAGASDVLGIELLGEHLKVAKKVCRDVPQVRFLQAHLGDYIAGLESLPRYDVVLALGIIHKLHDPGIPMRFAARVARDLVIFRAPAYSKSGVVKSKHSDTTCDVNAIMEAEGYTEEKKITGVRGEAAQYWRRK